jgi:hypothetical protein
MLADLFRRRVPQIVGLYAVGCWTVVEFLDWAVERYVLSPHITSFVVALLLLLLPSVVLLAWRFGAPGDDHWTRTESIAIPVNLLVAAAVLYVGFHGKYLGAATTMVVVEDDAGNPVLICTRTCSSESYRHGATTGCCGSCRKRDSKTVLARHWPLSGSWP